MANDKKQNEAMANKNESDKYYFEVWSYYENVAMHFNDLIIKLRIQSIGGLATLATIMGIFLHNTKDNNNDSFNYGLATIGLVVFMAFWMAIYFLDMRYYNRLLEGSVNAILQLEKDKNGFLEKKEINLSTNIEEAFINRFKHEKKTCWKKIKDGRNLFYLLVFVGLSIPCIICFIMWWKETLCGAGCY